MSSDERTGRRRGCSNAGRRAAAIRTRRAGSWPGSDSRIPAASARHSTRSSARSPTSSRRCANVPSAASLRPRPARRRRSPVRERPPSRRSSPAATTQLNRATTPQRGSLSALDFRLGARDTTAPRTERPQAIRPRSPRRGLGNATVEPRRPQFTPTTVGRCGEGDPRRIWQKRFAPSCREAGRSRDLTGFRSSRRSTVSSRSVGGVFTRASTCSARSGA